MTFIFYLLSGSRSIYSAVPLQSICDSVLDFDLKPNSRAQTHGSVVECYGLKARPI